MIISVANLLWISHCTFFVMLLIPWKVESVCLKCPEERGDSDSAYKVIDAGFGQSKSKAPRWRGGAIETPDQPNYCPTAPKGQRHIKCGGTSTWSAGDVFRFKLFHNDEYVSCDPVSKGNRKGVQRVEIKVTPNRGQRNELKAFRGDSMEFKWKFRILSKMKFSRSFTYLFQIKSTSNSECGKSPVITLTARKDRRGQEFLMLENIDRASPCRKNNVLVKKPLKKGKWLDVVMKAIFLPKAEGGRIEMNISNGGESVLSYNGPAQLWRTQWCTNQDKNRIRDCTEGAFARPKWGIYRSMKPELNDANVYFIDICIDRQ